ncbi:hypothetical protein COM38_26880 [Bacillus toyonensis]|uniref:DUF4238 domain-containing protein n=1 Tax=Bacillus toyonensis TaxID=155322 RepID=UPI000BEB8CC8|nr:DUF4238 domain-containing protein [Bacillus toyonensis]PEC07527.1 hypothetical protein CON55_28590 [Bacillus toyonensis]PGD49318.1 hypothetical protein COM38_26880 [Bacillus toyonensis]
MEKKRGQHYVWRYYLTAWTDKLEQLVCLRNGNLFSINPKKIAKERDFYRLRNLSKREIAIVLQLFIDGHGTKEGQRMDKQWLSACVSPFWNKEELVRKGEWDDKKEEEFDVLINNFAENYHSKIEDHALPYLDHLKNSNIDFLNSEEDKLRFMYFVCLQYMRTNMLKNNIQEAVKAAQKQNKFQEPIDHNLIDNIWSVLYVIFARRFAFSISFSNSHRFLILKNKSTIPFITGDQPVINTRSDYSDYTETKKLELYYPITPSLALLIMPSRNGNKYQSILEVQEDEVKLYNDLIFKASFELLFSNDVSVLQSFKNNIVPLSD